MTLVKLIFLSGVICSKLISYPSKHFLTFLAVLLSGLTVYLGSGFSRILLLLPEFFKEWWQVGSMGSFVMYLVVASSILFIYVAISMVKGAAFDIAVLLKQWFGFRFVPW